METQDEISQPFAINEESNSINDDKPDLKDTEDLKDTTPKEFPPRKSIFSKPADGIGLSEFDGSSALLSTIIGGGIVAIPYGTYLSGIPFSLLANVACWFLCYLSVKLYMRAKMMSEISVKTLYEFGYVAIGKSSIYIIASLAAC